MKYRIGDCVPYINGEGFSSPIIDQLVLYDAVEIKAYTKVLPKKDYILSYKNNEIVMYDDGWDYVSSLVPTEVYYSSLYQALKED